VLNGGSPNGVSSLDNAGVAAVIGPGSYHRDWFYRQDREYADASKDHDHLGNLAL
jgi:hypothetical protein